MPPPHLSAAFPRPAPQLYPGTVRGMFWQGVFELEPHRANGHPKSQGWWLSIVLGGGGPMTLPRGPTCHARAPVTSSPPPYTHSCSVLARTNHRRYPLPGPASSGTWSSSLATLIPSKCSSVGERESLHALVVLWWRIACVWDSNWEAALLNAGFTCPMNSDRRRHRHPATAIPQGPPDRGGGFREAHPGSGGA